MSSSKTEKEEANVYSIPVLVDWHGEEGIRNQQEFVGVLFLGLQLLVPILDGLITVNFSFTVPDSKAMSSFGIKKKSCGAHVSYQGCFYNQRLVSRSLNFRIFAF